MIRMFLFPFLNMKILKTVESLPSDMQKGKNFRVFKKRLMTHTFKLTGYKD